MSVFRFKEFSIIQDRSAMKVGTDAMLLGSFIEPNQKGNCLEIGTGTGVISLMIAQRSSELKITALDIDSESIEEANQNFNNSPWKDRVEGVLGDFLEYSTSQKYDLIVSNPPYFENGLLNESKRKASSRHEASLPLIDLFQKSCFHLTEKGMFVLILPSQSASKWTDKALEMNLNCFKEITVFGKTNLPKRSILFFSKENKESMNEELIIRNLDNTYTEEYKKLTLDFHGVEL
jgi:tRNA1Val (adenine37-N6)-methyltransferase